MDDKSFNIRVPKRWVRMGMVALVTAVIVAPLTAIAAHTFTDVPDTNTFHEDIAWLKDAGVTLGCNPPANTQFCPKDNVTREQMSAFMRRLAENQVVDAATAVQADSATTADSATNADNADNADNLGGMAPSEFVETQQILTAGVTTGGTLNAGNALSATHPSTGEYRVTFDRSTVGCTGGVSGGWTASGTNSVFHGVNFVMFTNWGGADTVRVAGWNSHAEAAADSGFTLVLACPADELASSASDGVVSTEGETSTSG